jgi:Uncharacterized protein involved in propionate catabolism, COG2079
MEESQGFSREMVSLFDQNGKSMDFLSRKKMSMLGAATCNSFYMRVLKYDDEFSPGMIHPGAAIIPPLIAFSEEKEVSGSTFLLGLIIGVMKLLQGYRNP